MLATIFKWQKTRQHYKRLIARKFWMCKRSVRQNFSVYFQVVGKVIKGPGGEWAARSHAWMNKRRVVLQTMRWSRSGRPVAESVLQWTAECPEGVTLSEFGVPFLTFFWNHRIFFSGVQISWVDDRLDRMDHSVLISDDVYFRASPVFYDPFFDLRPFIRDSWLDKDAWIHHNILQKAAFQVKQKFRKIRIQSPPDWSFPSAKKYRTKLKRKFRLAPSPWLKGSARHPWI